MAKLMMRLRAVTRLSPRRPTPKACDDDRPVVNPPDSVTTYDDRAPVLWTHDERPLVRRIGY